MKEDYDAARRVATSSEKRENLVETAVFQKGSRRKKPAWVQSFMERAFPPCMKNISIKHLQLFEDRSDAARCVVIKTRDSHRWEA